MNILIKTAKLKLAFFLFLTAIVFGGFLFMSHEAQAQYGSTCSEYGIMAYEDYSGYCKCMSGYVFQDSYLGTQCVSADSVCQDDYGIMSRYSSLSGRCECSYGYVLGADSIGRTRCVSENESCQNQLGYNSRATYGGQCECDYGYVIDNGQCADGDGVCRSDHGIYSEYNNLSNKCECDDGYTFDNDNQCIKKHNSAYFTLLDISENGDELLVQSQYDFQNYIIEFGIGCWDYAIESYKGNDVVVNMGTDYSVDMFDTLVLPNHDQNCSIMSVDSTSDDSFPESEEEIYYYTPPTRTFTPTISNPEPTFVAEPVSYEQNSPIISNLITDSERGTNPQDENMQDTTLSQASSSEAQNSKNKPLVVEPDTKKESFFKRIISFFKSWF